ncbi:disease resistance RPP13-like protein 1 [Pyrus ussuriensis x Pyrus communis]|uniref:Disease resistance RPP13-like protein 1 n=1 Tax=Pyrus ussuriensis x Pyrus communis TaxID=2448454 RepID=A0A5N5F0N4_9ROSA|nr:disease resistance RPP13-like protein 1 [Pyrus ussuriensis x Pyrus communis]
MAGALIGEAFLSASIQVMCDKIGSGGFWDLFRGKRLDRLLMEKLMLTLLTLHAVLNDAEEKQIVNPVVGSWLDELKHVVFDAEDLLDEIDAEALRSKVEAEYQTKKTQVWNFLSTSLNPFYQGINGRILELFQSLEHLAKQINLLGLIGGVKGKISQRTPTTFLFEHEFCPCGKDGDKDKLKTTLLSDYASSSHVSVIPIVGMGGVGKTTHAQVLYNDEKIKEHFDVTTWACVSKDFDAMRVTKTLIESISSKPCSLQDNLLQVELREQVRGKKFLFVLDDLWNDNYIDWDLARAPFTYRVRGSKVIVTTRNKSVTSIVHAVPIHYLKHLSDEDCWLLLAKHAFRNENPSAHPDLEEIGKQIARKCNGIPLAAKALGGLLSCNVDYEEWSHILNNNFWGSLKLLDEGEPHEVPKRVRHLSYVRGRLDTVAKFKPLDEIKCLRTLFPMSLRPYEEWDLNYWHWRTRAIVEVELAWGREDANDSITERQVPESLQPSVNLVKLTIRFYGGTSFPDWLGSFSNIQVMRLTDCSTCLWLPPVGQSPALKELCIERMKSVMSISVEFYWGNGTSLIQPFQSLKKLELKEIPEWEEWLPCPGRDQSLDFPRLEELTLENCPKQRGNLPDNLPCLRNLSVSDCGVLHERATRMRWIPWSLIINTESLRQSLQKLKIVGCPGLSSLLETESLSSLSKLEIQIFSGRECLRPHFSNCLQRLSLVNCASLLLFPRNGLPTSFTYLYIKNCRRLEFLSHETMAKLTSLQDLQLRDSRDSLRSFPLGIFPKLSFLQIQGSKNLESLSIGEGADGENLTHLDEGGLPPYLHAVHIGYCEKLIPSMKYWGLQQLVSLRTFWIWSSKNLLEALLKEQLLPTTLHTLRIHEMEILKSLEGKGLQHLTCLQELEFHDCDSLEFLSKEGLPESLSFLSIKNCSSLAKRCQEKRGQEWMKIAHIPCIETNDQVIYWKKAWNKF